MILGGGGYSYTNTRIKAMKGKLLKPQDYGKMAKMSLPELASFISNAGYRREIDEMGTHFEGVNLIEYALARNLAHTFSKIMKFSIKDSKKYATLLTSKWDIWNIKTVLRGKQTGASDEEIFVLLIPAGKLEESFLKETISKARSVEEAIEAFARTPYYPLLKKHSKDLSAMEDALDRQYYKDLAKGAPASLSKYIRAEIDLVNSLNTARSKASAINFMPLEGGTRNLKEIGVENLQDLEIAYREKLMKLGNRMLHEFSYTPRPMMGYFLAKENETRNIRILARGKHSGLPEETIEKHMVV